MAETLGSELRAPPNAHLRKLHAIAPALTVAAVEAALVAKDALRRRRRDGPDAGFVDDGFALGLAFALKVRVVLPICMLVLHSMYSHCRRPLMCMTEELWLARHVL